MKKLKFIMIPALAGALVLGGCGAAATEKAAEPEETTETLTEGPAETPAETEVPAETPVAEHQFTNIAVFGLDDKTDGTPEINADSIKLLALDYDEKKINIASPSRELLTFVDEGKVGKIGSAYAIGREDKQLEVVNRTFGLDFDKYVSFDYDAIKVLVDHFGGIDIDLTEEEIKQTNHPLNISGPAGTYTLNGKQAVAYCRIVKIDGEEQRSDRVSKVAEQLAKKMSDAGAIEMAGLISKVLPYLHTNLKADEMIQLATDFIAMKGDAVVSNYVPKNGERKADGIAVEDYSALAKEVHDALYNGYRAYTDNTAEFNAEMQEALANH